MPRVITINDLKILEWTVDINQRRVIASYELLEDNGDQFYEGVAIFWDTIPDPEETPDGILIPNPDSWYQLPAQYSQVLTDLTGDLRTGLLHLINE